MIDGNVGDKNISNHFSGIYETLFNSVPSDEALNELLKNININISEESLSDVDKISSTLIKDAINHLQKNKSDVSYDWKSDAFIQGAEALCSPLAFLFKSFLIHGHLSNFLLLCSLVPLIKDNLGSNTSSSNYRAIYLQVSTNLVL